jgi:serine/threonine protein kinase
MAFDMEFSWKDWSKRRPATADVDSETRTGPPHVETYINRFAIRDRSDVIRRLVLEEIALRRRFGINSPRIDDYRRRFPEIRLPDTVFEVTDGLAGDTAVVPVQGARETARVEPLPRPFGPYQLVERIGAGGMGVVYRAHQANLGRDVAVKLLRVDHLINLQPDGRQALIDRFRNESRATARIDHPHIVTVHDVGEVDGVPYYAMQYVAGSSLADVVKSELPRTREAARLCRDIATAVQAAHDYGILHRDLKPHNIIVAADSRAPVVADFGLAKLLDDEASPTVTGEILGTPQYMSPEQVQDSGGVTIRSDVYSLGALLYFLLTGRAPFAGRSHLEILKQVIDSDPVPPRDFNPQLDADLEVICLKCLQKDPQQRYASAGALASDLSNWLDGAPIAARPPGRWERLSRWFRRNPLPGVLAVATAAALVFGVGALWVGYAHASEAYSVATVALDDAKASDRSARAAVNDFFTIVSEDVLLNRPAMQPLRRELLERALTHYQEFLQLRANDPVLLVEIAATHDRIGRVKDLIESSAAALPSYETAAAMQRVLLREHPGDVEIERALGSTLNAMGACLMRLGRFDEGRIRK